MTARSQEISKFLFAAKIEEKNNNSGFLERNVRIREIVEFVMISNANAYEGCMPRLVNPIPVSVNN